MVLSELEIPVTTKNIADTLQEFFNFKIPIQLLDESKVEKMLNRIQTRLYEYRIGSKYLLSEQDNKYLALLTTSKLLEQWLFEAGSTVSSKIKQAKWNEYMNEHPTVKDAFGALLNQQYSKDKAQQALIAALKANPSLENNFNDLFRASLNPVNSEESPVKDTPVENDRTSKTVEEPATVSTNSNTPTNVKKNNPPSMKNIKSRSTTDQNDQINNIGKKILKHLGPHRIIPHVAGSALGAFKSGLYGQALSSEHGKINTGAFDDIEKSSDLTPDVSNTEDVKQYAERYSQHAFDTFNPKQQQIASKLITKIYNAGAKHKPLNIEKISTIMSNSTLFSQWNTEQINKMAEKLYKDLYSKAWYAK